MEPKAFQQLVKNKEIALTAHAKDQLVFRQMSETALRKDLLELPVAVSEQECEDEGERKFEVYYPQIGENYHTYIVIVSKDRIRAISAWRSNRIRQIDISRGRTLVKR